jgi:nicotinamidase-related amidase
MHLPAASTAVITMELQRGICGAEARWAALRDAVAERGVEANVGRLLTAVRPLGVPVFHCTFSVGPDSTLDLPMLRTLRDDPTYLRHGAPDVALLPALGPEPTDVIVDRHHGVSPFGGTVLDTELSSRAITTVVVCGVSLNIGIPGTVIEAVNAGYSAVVVSDAVVGIPRDYGDAVLRNTIAPMATLADVDTIIAALS